MVSPNTRTGSSARVRAERPTMKTPNVNTAVKKGEENAENSSATPETTATSQRVKAAPPSSTRLSSGEWDDNHAPAASSRAAAIIGAKLRSGGTRQPSSAA